MNKPVRCLRALLAFGLFACPCTAMGQGAGGVLTLREAVRMAVARGPEVFLAQAEAARAREAAREARSANLPQVMAGTGLAYNNGFPLSIEGAAPSIIQFGVSQSIFSRKNSSLILEAERGTTAADAGKDVVINALVARTVQLYGELHQARLAVPLIEAQRASAGKIVQTAETLQQAGRLRPLDLTQARLTAAGLDQQLLVARERVRVAEAALREITGAPTGETVRTEKPEIRSELLSLSAEALYEKVLGAHPAVQEAEAAWHAKEAHVEAEKAERHPQFSAIGQYALFSRTNNYQDYFNRFTRNNYLVGLSIQVPLFNGFRTDARSAQSRHEAEVARQKLVQLKSDLRMSLERSASNLRVAAGAAELARMEVAAFEEKVKISETLAEAGRMDARDLENVRAQLLEKKAAAVEAERALLERQVVLLQASGTLPALFD